MTTVEDVINFYVTVSELDHNSQLRNGSMSCPACLSMQMTSGRSPRS